MNHPAVTLSGHNLTPQELLNIANGCKVELCANGLATMQSTRQILEAAAQAGTAVYGVTTGLGPKVTDALPDNSIDTFSTTTIRGRAHAVGDALAAVQVRAGMAVRVNTLLSGAAGARPDLAQHISACLNNNLTPVIPQIGSIGVADLSWGGTFGSCLIGEGQMLTSSDTTVDAKAAMRAAGITPYSPQLREGLALVSHSSFSAGLSALAWCELQQTFHAAQTAAALSMEGFRANLSPLDKRVLALRAQAGQQQVAEQLRSLLGGSALFANGAARRLQDPLSLRNIVQVHGAVQACLNTLQDAVSDEINGASDNPAVVLEDKEVLSHGGYLPVYLAIALTAALHAVIHLAALQVSRISKLLFTRFSDLNNGLTTAGAAGAGMAPLMKTAETLYAEIAHLATPAPIYPGISADGLEDIVTHAAIPAKAAFAIAHRLRLLSAIELLVAAQAIDVRDIHQLLPVAVAEKHRLIRETSSVVEQDRSLGSDIETIAQRIANGLFEPCNN